MPSDISFLVFEDDQGFYRLEGVGPIEDRKRVPMTKEEADAWVDAQSLKYRVYITPEDVEKQAFCLERVDDFPEDDYCYLHIIVGMGENQQRKIIVYNYPPEFGSVVHATAKEVPVVDCWFDEDGLLTWREHGRQRSRLSPTENI